MSTGADNKTMPVTAAYAEGHARLFGDKPPQRGYWVMRCEKCDGVTLAAGETRYDCGGCGDKDCRGSVNLNEAPPLPIAATNAPILAGRFYENTAATIADEKGQPLKVDIGSRMRHREFMKRRGVTSSSDYAESWKPEAMARRAAEADLQDTKERREAIGRSLYGVEKAGKWK